jgi:hypothetical protein
MFSRWKKSNHKRGWGGLNTSFLRSIHYSAGTTFSGHLIKTRHPEIAGKSQKKNLLKNIFVEIWKTFPDIQKRWQERKWIFESNFWTSGNKYQTSEIAMRKIDDCCCQFLNVWSIYRMPGLGWDKSWPDIWLGPVVRYGLLDFSKKTKTPITFRIELRFWWSWTFPKAYLVYSSQ